MIAICIKHMRAVLVKEEKYWIFPLMLRGWFWMDSRCSKCKKELPLKSFCKIKGKVSRICLKCDRQRHEEDYLKKFKVKVMQRYNGRCTMCNRTDMLNIIPIESLAQKKRRNPGTMILICDECKRDGIPALPDWIRTCLRCSHNWIAKTKITTQCPKCHSAYWHIPRK
jgi:hypothetical protein